MKLESSVCTKKLLRDAKNAQRKFSALEEWFKEGRRYRESNDRCCMSDTTERCLRRTCDALHVIIVAINPNEITENTNGMA